jgi:F-type H+-transporting ATPase subunit epsilon
MAELIRFELVSPEKLVHAADVQMVLVPGSEGDMGVLPGHAPVMTTIRPGVLDVTTRSGNMKRFYIKGGFAEINPEQITVLAQTSIDLDDLDAEHISADIRDLEEDVADAKTDEQRRKAETALAQLKALQSALSLPSR